MDIRRAYEEAKSLPDEVLQRELDSPTGMIPGYIVLGELQERKSIRQTTPPQGYSEGGMIARINPFIAYIEAMQNPEQGNMGEAELMERGFKGMTPMMPPQAPAAPQAPMSNSMLVPMAPGKPEKPYHYATGGSVGLRQLTPYQRALLNTISGPESGGRYNVMYGGRRFGDYSRHPNVANRIQSGPNKGKTSTAAGKYQFLKGTWDTYQRRLGLPDFSPASQDQAAWALARDRYKAITGGDLDAALQSGDPNKIAGVGKALRGTWTSLPGGIEQGTTTSKFVNAYNRNLGRPQKMAPVQRAVTPSKPGPSGMNTYATSVATGTGNAGSKPVTAGTTAATVPQFAAARQAAAQAAASNANLFRSPLAAAAPTGINMPVAKPAGNPFGGLMSLMMMAQMQQEPQQVVVKDDSEFGVNKQQVLPSNPVAELNAVRQTQPVNNRRRRAFI